MLKKNYALRVVTVTQNSEVMGQKKNNELKGSHSLWVKYHKPLLSHYKYSFSYY